MNNGSTNDNLNFKIIPCYICEKTFNTKSYLIIHGRIYSRETPYKCGTCDKNYSGNYLTSNKLLFKFKK